jgi:hypothetical protein
MIEGFVKVEMLQFSEIWGRIKSKVEAVESNWAQSKKGERPIVIKWGYKDPVTGEDVILASSRGDADGDQHWVDAALLSDLGKVDR